MLAADAPLLHDDSDWRLEGSIFHALGQSSVCAVGSSCEGFWSSSFAGTRL